MIFEKVAKMFLGRFEEFEQMTSKERDEALQDAARNMAHEEQQIAEGTYRPFDNMDLRTDFNKNNVACYEHRLHRCWWRQTKYPNDNFEILVTDLAEFVTNIPKRSSAIENCAIVQIISKWT